MKYTQLTQLESGWKWNYLLRQHRLGAALTQQLDPVCAAKAIDDLVALEHQMDKVDVWISRYLRPDVARRLSQTVRAKRKRYFNAENPSIRKKSIDLTYCVWSKLSQYAKDRKLNLSQAINLLIDQASLK